jgi:hypothetical protein
MPPCPHRRPSARPPPLQSEAGRGLAARTLARAGPMEQVLHSRRSAERDRAVALVAGRFLEATSRLALARTLDPETATSTLGELLEWRGPRAIRSTRPWIRRREEERSAFVFGIASSRPPRTPPFNVPRSTSGRRSPPSPRMRTASWRGAGSRAPRPGTPAVPRARRASGAPPPA